MWNKTTYPFLVQALCIIPLKSIRMWASSYIFVKTEKQLKRLYLKEIQFIEGMENYIVIHTLTSKEIVHLRLKSILETLPAQIFMQVHRSFIVNLSYVQAIEGNLLIIGEHKIPVSRPLREEVYKSIVNNQLIQR